MSDPEPAQETQLEDAPEPEPEEDTDQDHPRHATRDEQVPAEPEAMAALSVGIQKGIARTWNDSKGFGFIAPENGGDDIFVHHSAITTDGYRCLTENEPVEYEVILADDGRSKAQNVTGPGRGPLRGVWGHEVPQLGTVVKWRQDKGFGFIKPDQGEGDIFVHQSVIVSTGYRELGEGEEVEYSTHMDNGRLKAKKVTARGGKPLAGSTKEGGAPQGPPKNFAPGAGGRSGAPQTSAAPQMAYGGAMGMGGCYGGPAAMQGYPQMQGYGGGGAGSYGGTPAGYGGYGAGAAGGGAGGYGNFAAFPAAAYGGYGGYGMNMMGMGQMGMGQMGQMGAGMQTPQAGMQQTPQPGACAYGGTEDAAGADRGGRGGGQGARYSPYGGGRGSGGGMPGATGGYGGQARY